MVGARAVTAPEALAEARRLLAAARKPAVLVWAHASNEELDALQSLLGARLQAYVRQDHQPAPGEVSLTV